MKVIYKIACLTFSAWSLLGCESAFDITPETQIAESPAIFENEAGLQTFSNGFYNSLDFNSIKDDKFSDNMEHIASPPTIRTALYTLPTALGSGGWSWTELRNLNYFITNVEQYTKDEELKNRYLGLAKFFRAWFYFKKVKTFGDVPLYTKVLGTNDEDLYKGRDERTVVMDHVLSDLNFAIEHLPAEKNKNRISKWTALALKSRISLFEGSWRKYHSAENLPDADKWLEECAAAAKELMDANVYNIYTTATPETDYAAMFQAAEANPDEVILARSASQIYFYYTPEFTSTSNGNYGATHSLISDYTTIEGDSYYTSRGGDIMEVEYFDEFQNRDLRLKQSVVYPGYVRIGTSSKSVNDFAQNRTGYQVTKRVGPPLEDQGNDSRDAILIRYAEVLLNYAEARAILGRLTQSDLDLTVNRLRERAGVMKKMTLPLLTDALQLNRYKRTTDPNVLEICRERRVELAFEGFRRDDLIRWNEGHLFRSEYQGIYIKGFNQLIDLDRDGKYDLYVVNSTDPLPTDRVSGVQYFKLSSVNGLSEGNSGRLTPYNITKKNFEDWEYLSPIPQEEITLNTNLTQNPGWDKIQ
ncbi:RagB/SusD family nutrient uptake outer membrane protein [Olivibacter oleidegradans]|uniref:RagB/SusD family nutrient uptake outer membrane protein n=1 Tax=Olivibacter oleidegradans TaxID=760123 RepID=A0ABV6HPC1_9SPHI